MAAATQRLWGAATALAFLYPAVLAYRRSEGGIIANTLAAQSVCGAAVLLGAPPAGFWMAADRALMLWHLWLWLFTLPGPRSRALDATVVAAAAAKGARYLVDSEGGQKLLLNTIWRLLLWCVATSWLGHYGRPG
ncbi:MAG: hypothetical protein VYE81_07470 [Planctomycetota bacterium]|nr:hypothetical protein [Planctomycetota bacterium]